MIAAHFDNRQKLVEFLAMQLQKGRLALFAGAGISMKLETGDDGLLMGLPDWPTLMNNLYGLKGNRSKKYTNNTNFPKVAEDFRIKYCNGLDEDWLDSVSKALYKGSNLEF